MGKINKIILFLYTFFVIYLPDFSVYFPFLPNTSILVFFLATLNLVLLNKHILWVIKKNEIYAIFIVLFILIIQLTITNLGDFDLGNLWPLGLFIVQIINYLSLVIWFYKLYHPENVYSLLKYLVFIGMIQFFIILFMQLQPDLKNIAVTLYGGKEGVPERLRYLLSYRIYGIASSYTFMLPLIQTFFSVIALYLYSEGKGFFYFITSVLLIYSSIVNGRTGMYIYIIIMIIYFLKQSLQKFNLKILIFSFGTLIIFVISVLFILNFYPDRFAWITEGIEEIILLFFAGETSQNTNVGRLIGEHLVFPKGFDIIFGLGKNIFSGITYRNNYIHSDIGYINDLFRGGIIYIFLLYPTILSFFNKYCTKPFLKTSLVLFFVIANYKGEITGGTPIILLILLIPMLISYNDMYISHNK